MVVGRGLDAARHHAARHHGRLGVNVAGGITKARPILSDRAGKPIALGVGLLVAIWLAVYLPLAAQGWTGAHIAWDFDSYARGVDRFFTTGTPYDPANIAGPHDRDGMGFVHPPVALWLFVPLRLVPPLWWILPLGVVAWSLWTWRPRPLTWAVMAVLMAFPLSIESLFLGNSSLLMMGAIAAGLRLGWPFVLLVAKPTLLPFALLGIRRRSMWVGFAVVGLLSVPFGGLWLDWISVLRNLEAEPAYNLYNLPLLLVPVVAWLGRTKEARSLRGVG